MYRRVTNVLNFQIIQKQLPSPTVGEGSEMNVEAEKQAPVPVAPDDKAKPASMFGIGMFSVPIQKLKDATSRLFSKSTQREVESVNELKPPQSSSTKPAGGPEMAKTGRGSDASSSSPSNAAKESPVAGSRIPRPMVQSVPANSPGAVGRTSKLVAAPTEPVKRRQELVSKMVSAIEKKQTPTEKPPPPVVYSNTRVSFCPDEDEEMDISKLAL